MFVLFFGIVSCEKDEAIENPSQAEQDKTILKFVHGEEIWSNEELAATLQGFVDKNNTENRIIQNKELGYTLYTDRALYIETESGYHSYTFYISFDNPTDNYLNNVMLSLNEKGGYDVFGVEYLFTPDDFKDITLSELESSDVYLTPIDLNPDDILGKVSGRGGMPGAFFSCDEIWTWKSRDCDEGQLDGDNDRCGYWDVEYVNCEIVGSYTTGTGSFDNFPNWPEWPDDGDGHGSGSTGNGTHTGPVLSPNHMLIKNLFLDLVGQLNLQPGEGDILKNWLYDNEPIALYLNTFLNLYVDDGSGPSLTYEERLDFLGEGVGFLIDDGYSDEAWDFLYQVMENFKNSGTPTEGNDQDYDSNFWDNNPSFQQQQLPSFQDFNEAYPKLNGGKMPSDQVFNLIGGNVLALANMHGYTNACAARVSRALNYSGVTIPQITGQTFQGADNKYYFLGAKNLFEWMKATFSLPDISLNQTQLGMRGLNFFTTVNGAKGIYIMIPDYPAQFGASGHADIFNGSTFNAGGYFNPAGGLHSANLWILD